MWQETSQKHKTYITFWLEEIKINAQVMTNLQIIGVDKRNDKTQ